MKHLKSIFLSIDGRNISKYLNILNRDFVHESYKKKRFFPSEDDKWKNHVTAKHPLNLIMKRYLNSDGQIFHQYQQNEQSPLTSNHWL